MSIVGDQERYRFHRSGRLHGTRQLGIFPTVRSSISPQVTHGVDVMNWEHNITDADRRGVIRQP